MCPVVPTACRLRSPSCLPAPRSPPPPATPLSRLLISTGAPIVICLVASHTCHLTPPRVALPLPLYQTANDKKVCHLRSHTYILASCTCHSPPPREDSLKGSSESSSTSTSSPNRSTSPLPSWMRVCISLLADLAGDLQPFAGCCSRTIVHEEEEEFYKLLVLCSHCMFTNYRTSWVLTAYLAGDLQPSAGCCSRTITHSLHSHCICYSDCILATNLLGAYCICTALCN